MKRNHSWTWLPSRLTNLQSPVPAANVHKRRPCLAMLEQLEDRVLLSSASTGGTDAVLIGLLKGELDLRASQLQFLKLAEDSINGNTGALDAFAKIHDSLLKIDAAVYALTGDSLASHKASAPGQQFLKIKLEDVIVTSFAEIDKQLGAMGDGSVDKLLPAVQRLQDATKIYTDSLSLLPAVQQKELGGFLKIQGELLKIDGIVDGATDLAIKGNFTTIKEQTALKKVDEAFLKLDNEIIAVFGDGSVTQQIKGEVDGFKSQTEGILIGLLAPSPVTGAAFTGGVTTPATGDTIS